MAQSQHDKESPAPPSQPRHDTASSVDEQKTAALPAAAGDDALAFLDRPVVPGELGRLAHYRVLKELGRGGMGCVLLAEDTKLQRKVALKVMLPQHAKNPTAKERFLREARSAARIKHDHVITIHQVDEANGVPFIALEFLEGASLDKYLKDKGALPLPLAVRITREMALGLAAAHKQGLIHRDVKPGNVWLEALPASPGRKSGGFRIKLLDFGLARAEQEDTHLTQSGAIIGTPAFMAPEQARSEKVDARCDLWSLGVVLYRLCTGKQPFAGPTTMSVLTAIALDVPPARSVNPNIPEALEKIIDRLLQKDPAKRYQTAQEVIADLNAVAKALMPTAKTQEAPTEALPLPSPPVLRGRGAGGEGERPRRRLPLLLAVAGGLAVLIVLGIVIFWPTPQGTVRIESDDPDVQIVFDQNGPSIKGVDKETIQLRAGEHGFVVKRGDLTFETTKFVLKKGETVTLKVELLGGKLQVVKDGEVVAARAVPLAKTFKNTLGMEFVLVPKGKFWMGGGEGNVGNKEVEIPHDFYLGQYEVTQEEWEKVTGLNPSFVSRIGGGKDAVKDIADAELKRFPVENVTWDDCQAFLKMVNENAKEPGWMYRLPTEAEWEYACRGGPSSNKFDYGFDFYFDKPSLQLQPDQANFNRILNRTCKVGSYQPNKLGLYDMHGNVWEWCEDFYDPKDQKPASQRVHRGGGWTYVSGDCRAANRGAAAPSSRYFGLGMRLARVPVGAAR